MERVCLIDRGRRMSLTATVSRMMPRPRIGARA
jgi:hypothetical protein